jgi:hypothetical protein
VFELFATDVAGVCFSHPVMYAFLEKL